MDNKKFVDDTGTLKFCCDNLDKIAEVLKSALPVDSFITQKCEEEGKSYNEVREHFKSVIEFASAFIYSFVPNNKRNKKGERCCF